MRAVPLLLLATLLVLGLSMAVYFGLVRLSERRTVAEAARSIGSDER